MPKPDRLETNLPRVILALAVAVIVPSTVIVLAIQPEPDATPPGLLQSILQLPAAWLIGVLWGWPYVLAASIPWAFLHSPGKVRWWSALAVGAATGLIFAKTAGMVLDLDGQPTATMKMVLFATLGAVTGLAVWATAYWRPWRRKPDMAKRLAEQKRRLRASSVKSAKVDKVKAPAKS